MSEGTKRCPYCAEEIQAEAVLCRFCQKDLTTGADAPAAPPPKRASGGLPVWAIVLLVVGACCFFVPVIAAIAIPGLLASQRASNERNASTSLKTISSAQADFRANDRDGNRVNDFWTLDVAGLYTIRNWRDRPEEPIRLIELSVAAADAAPAIGENNAVGGHPGNYGDIRQYVIHTAKAGYWYIALRQDASDPNQAVYQTGTRGVDGMDQVLEEEAWHPSKFGAMAFPDSLAAGKSVFRINESNTVYKQLLQDECRNPSRGVPPGPPDYGGLQPPGSELDWPSDEELKSIWRRID